MIPALERERLVSFKLSFKLSFRVSFKAFRISISKLPVCFFQAFFQAVISAVASFVPASCSPSPSECSRCCISYTLHGGARGSDTLGRVKGSRRRASNLWLWPAVQKGPTCLCGGAERGMRMIKISSLSGAVSFLRLRVIVSRFCFVCLDGGVLRLPIAPMILNT